MDFDEQNREEARRRAIEVEGFFRKAGYDADAWRPDWNALYSPFMDCVHRESRGFIMRGGTGCGKTTFLRALKAVCAKSGVQYIDCARAADYEWLDWEETPMKLAENAFVLLDDMGTDEVVTVYGNRRDRIGRLVMEWAEWPHQYGKHTAMLVVATNLTGEQLAARYGERVMSRLRDLRPVVLRASDHRGWQRFGEGTANPASEGAPRG